MQTTTEARVVGLERRNDEQDDLLAQIKAAVADLKSKVAQGGGGQQAGFLTGEIRLAKNGVTAIPAATGDTPGSGTVRLWKSNGVGQPATDTGLDVTALNWADGAGQTVGANKKLKVAKVNGDWYVIWELCNP